MKAFVSTIDIRPQLRNPASVLRITCSILLSRSCVWKLNSKVDPMIKTA